MDHLLISKSPAHPRIEVPYLSKTPYDGHFDSFLSQHGWGEQELRKSDLTANELEELESLLQTWLFFGLLEEVFGKPISVSDWVRKGRNGRDVLTTSLVRPWLKDLHEGLLNESTAAKESSRQDYRGQQHIEMP